MASSSHDTRRASSDAPECIEEIFRMENHYNKRLRPRSLICGLKDVSTLQRYSEQLSRSNDPEEQLLQKIRDGASVEVLESHLNLTFQNISDRIDVEINLDLAFETLDTQGKERDRRCALARGWIYDKALGEAKDDTPIKEFLVRKLRTDDCLQKGGHCPMVDCSAARWNMVNIVLASIRWRHAAEGGRVLRKEELLAIAIEYGHVELVQHLTKMQDVDVNISSNDIRDGLTFREYCKPYAEKLADKKDRSLRNHIAFLKPIGSAARMGNVEMVKILLACDRIDLPQGEPLHWAAAMGHPDVVKELLQSQKEVDVNAVNYILLADEYVKPHYGSTFSPLHLASLFGHASVVKALSEDTKGRLRANTENNRGITTFEIATEMRYGEIVEILKERAEVPKYVDNLYRDRQAHVDAANAILVGAALIASVTFAGWLQPPLGYSAFLGSASNEVGAQSPSGIYPSFVSVAGHPIMQIFWFFNSISFFFAIATLMVGATAARPLKRGMFIGEVVRSLRASLSLAYILLTVSVGCVMGAFASAGFLVLPPIPKYMVNMGVTVGIGVTVVFLAWTSSKVAYVLNVIKKIVKKIIYWMIHTRIMRKILCNNLRWKLHRFSREH
ncbi:unnamed protein product [Sphagnum jensenii]|uniref:PGG domain-containing protein n=1 Tax=Sphagnum jensenii TaxID=128206 RepID=A0ABP1AMP1_9BRYO